MGGTEKRSVRQGARTETRERKVHESKIERKKKGGSERQDRTAS